MTPGIAAEIPEWLVASTSGISKAHPLGGARHRRSLPTMLGLVCCALLGMHAHAQTDDPLASLRWQNRLVLVFAPAGDDPQLLRQQAVIEGLGSARDERDLLAIFVVGAHAYGAPGALDAAVLRHRFEIDAAHFRVLLIGKDGGVKYRADAPIDDCTLLGLIDAMPMRQRELSPAARARPGCAPPAD